MGHFPSFHFLCSSKRCKPTFGSMFLPFFPGWREKTRKQETRRANFPPWHRVDDGLGKSEAAGLLDAGAGGADLRRVGAGVLQPGASANGGWGDGWRVGGEGRGWGSAVEKGGGGGAERESQRVALLGPQRGAKKQTSLYLERVHHFGTTGLQSSCALRHNRTWIPHGLRDAPAKKQLPPQKNKSELDLPKSRHPQDCFMNAGFPLGISSEVRSVEPKLVAFWFWLVCCQWNRFPKRTPVEL